MAATRLRLSNIFSNNLQLFGARRITSNQTNIRQSHVLITNPYRTGLHRSLIIDRNNLISTCKYKCGQYFNITHFFICFKYFEDF